MVAALSIAGALGLWRCAPAAPPRVVVDTPDASEPAPPDPPAARASSSADGGREGEPEPAVAPERNPAADADLPASPRVVVDGDAAPACSAEKKIRWLPAAPEAWTTCGKDSHCTIVPNRCCTCGVLPASEARAVNRPSVENGNPFCGQETGCPRCAGFPNPELEAVCLSGHCRVRETTDPCKPRRPGR